jgi:YVTN family beta-propeller protein
MTHGHSNRWCLKMLWSAAVVSSVAAQDLLILHKADSSLGFYSAGGKLEKRVPVNQHPHEMVISPDGRFAYTTDNGTMRIEQAGTGGNTVSIIDLVKREKVGEISTGDFRRPHGIAWIARTGQLLVSTELPDKLLLIDPRTRAIVKKFDTQGKTAHMVTVDAKGDWAFVSNSSSSNVSAINLETGAVTLIPTGPRPEGSVLSPDGKWLYVCQRDSSGIAMIDTATRKLKRTLDSGKGPVRIDVTPDGRYVVYGLLDERAVGWTDTRSGKVSGRVELPATLGQIVSLHLSHDGRTAYAANENMHRAYAVDLKAKRLKQEFQLEGVMGPDPVMEQPHH